MITLVDAMAEEYQGIVAYPTRSAKLGGALGSTTSSTWFQLVTVYSHFQVVTNLHRSLVDLDSVELLGGGDGVGGLVELKGSDSPRLTVGAISDQSALNGSNNLAEVFL